MLWRTRFLISIFLNGTFWRTQNIFRCDDAFWPPCTATIVIVHLNLYIFPVQMQSPFSNVHLFRRWGTEPAVLGTLPLLTDRNRTFPELYTVGNMYTWHYYFCQLASERKTFNQEDFWTTALLLPKQPESFIPSFLSSWTFMIKTAFVYAFDVQEWLFSRPPRYNKQYAFV